MINYTWSITKLYVTQQILGCPNSVVAADWKCVGTDGTTQAQVLNWCWGYGPSGGPNLSKDFVQGAIANIINPPITTPPLPWAP